MTTLYNTDFYAWTQQQAALLDSEAFEELDINNLVEEIESMGRSEQRELENRLIVIIIHLLKIQCQPKRRSRSWNSTVQTQRVDLARHLRKNPSLRAQLAETVFDVYPDAVKKAAIETGILQARFPAVCPWTVEQIVNEGWLPE